MGDETTYTKKSKLYKKLEKMSMKQSRAVRRDQWKFTVEISDPIYRMRKGWQHKIVVV